MRVVPAGHALAAWSPKPEPPSAPPHWCTVAPSMLPPLPLTQLMSCSAGEVPADALANDRNECDLLVKNARRRGSANLLGWREQKDMSVNIIRLKMVIKSEVRSDA